MIFLGTTFFSGKHAFDAPAMYSLPVNEVNIRDGIYDNIYLSKNSRETIENTQNAWNIDTLLDAQFDGTFDAGNSGFSLRTTDTLIIKVREKGTFDWITIYKKEINTVDDFNLYELYRYCRGGDTDYEFMLVGVCNGIENSQALAEVKSNFEGFFVVDKENTVGTVYDIGDSNTVRNVLGQPLELKNSKYASYVSNGDTNYDSGTVSGTFLSLDEYENVNRGGGVTLRKNAIDILTDKKPRILKLPDGRIWLISINGKVQENRSEHDDKRQISFDWVEIGNVNDPKTLYEFGLSDITSEWWY